MYKYDEQRKNLNIKLWPGTREDRCSVDEDDMLDIKQHRGLIKIFAEHEIRQLDVICTLVQIRYYL